MVTTSIGAKDWAGLVNKALVPKTIEESGDLRLCFIKSASTISAKGKLNKLNEACTITLKEDKIIKIFLKHIFKIKMVTDA